MNKNKKKNQEILNDDTKVITDNSSLKETKTKKSKKVIKHKTKKDVVISSVVCISAISMGVTMGIVLNKVLKSPTVDYTNVDTNGIYQNLDGLLEKYESLKASNANYEEELTLGEIVNISRELYKNELYTKSVTKGDAKASIVNQNIRGMSIRNNNNYLTESTSKSNIVQVAWRMYQNENEINKYAGSLGKDVEDTKYEESNVETYSHDDFKTYYGTLLNEPFIYIISDNTILQNEHTTITKNSEGFKINLSLDPVKSSRSFCSSKDTVKRATNIFFTISLPHDSK